MARAMLPYRIALYSLPRRLDLGAILILIRLPDTFSLLRDSTLVV